MAASTIQPTVGVDAEGDGLLQFARRAWCNGDQFLDFEFIRRFEIVSMRGDRTISTIPQGCSLARRKHCRATKSRGAPVWMASEVSVPALAAPSNIPISRRLSWGFLEISLGKSI